MAVTKGDLIKNAKRIEQKHGVMWCAICGETWSANAGDYFSLDDSFEFVCPYEGDDPDCCHVGHDVRLVYEERYMIPIDEEPLMNVDQWAGAVARLIEIFTSGDNYHTRNPYSRPPIKNGLILLGRLRGMNMSRRSAYLDVDTKKF